MLRSILSAFCVAVLLPGPVQAGDAELFSDQDPLPAADGYRGIWYSNQPQGDEHVYKYSGGLGTYCAKHRPFAVYAKAAGKTFFCYGGTDKDRSTLLHIASYFDHATGTVPRPRILLDKRTTDAQDNPVISLDTWEKSKQLTRGSPYNHTYVRRPVNAHTDFYAFWADGHGRQPSASRLYFTNRAGDRVWRLPVEMAGPEVGQGLP